MVLIFRDFSSTLVLSTIWSNVLKGILIAYSRSDITWFLEIMIIYLLHAVYSFLSIENIKGSTWNRRKGVYNWKYRDERL